VLEFWSIGLHYSTTPLLQYSSPLLRLCDLGARKSYLAGIWRHENFISACEQFRLQCSAPELGKSSMIFDGKIDLDASAGQAWNFLIDVNRFSACLPGIEQVRQVDDRTFEGTLAAAVGPISGKFSFRSTIIDSRRPQQMVVRTEGADSVTKSTVHADMTIDLREVTAGKTEMVYRADVNIQGRLAILGDMVLRATASLILQEFANRLRRGLSDRAAT